MFSLLAAVALAGATLGAQSHAHEGYTKVEGRVSLAGLDLSNAADVAELEKRIERKARTICRRGVPDELKDSPVVQDCTASVVANGRDRLIELTSASQPLARLGSVN
ncbi:MAG TPA: UrcA family protein [Sphingomicrobium sp.]|nr:UrcA family protein [Sphingomicrobium sp.]